MYVDRVTRDIVTLLVVYYIVIWLTFATIYTIVGFGRHFVVPPNVDNGPGTPFYYAFAVQSNIGAGEISPKTPLARALYNMQQFLAYSPTLLLLAPWFELRGPAAA